jgi:hypothetical protein
LLGLCWSSAERKRKKGEEDDSFHEAKAIKKNREQISCKRREAPVAAFLIFAWVNVV